MSWYTQDHTCPTCGKTFAGYHLHQSTVTYCSNACRQKAYRQRKAAAKRARRAQHKRYAPLEHSVTPAIQPVTQGADDHA